MHGNFNEIVKERTEYKVLNEFQNVLHIEVKNLRIVFGGGDMLALFCFCFGSNMVSVCRQYYTSFTFNSPKYQYFWHLQLSRKLWKNVIVCCLQTLLLTDFTHTLSQTHFVRNTQRGNVIMFILIYLHKIKFYGFMVMTNIYLTATLNLTCLLFSQVIQLQLRMLLL